MLARWTDWVDAYATCCQHDTPCATPRDRARRLNQQNPKYVLRSWMATVAYQHAEAGDNSVVEDIAALLRHPYAEGSEQQQERWYRKTPAWAVNKPGVSFLS